MKDTIKVVEIWVKVERDLLDPESTSFTNARRKGAIKAYENVLELLKVHERHLSNTSSGQDETCENCGSPKVMACLSCDKDVGY